MWKESEAGTGSKEALLQAMTAYITKYDDTSATKPDLTLTTNVNPMLNDIDAVLVANWKAANKDKLGEFTAPVRLGLADDEATIAAIKAGAVNLFGLDGLPIQLKPGVSPEGVVTPDSMIVGADENGNLNIVVVPKLGSVEGVEEAEQQLSKKPNDLLPDWMTMNIDDKVRSIQSMVDTLKELDENGDPSGQSPWAVQDIMEQLMSFRPEELQNISTYIANALAALEDPVLDPGKAEELKSYLDSLQMVAEQADTYFGVGNDISAGIADGLKNYDWSGDASTLASDLEAAIRAATSTHSPSQMTIPIGQGISEGIGQGMTQYSLAGSAALVAESLNVALRSALNAATMRPVGVNAMTGLALGILSGRAIVVSAITRVAAAAVQAAKSQLKIESPSKVFQDDVGRMMTRGMAKGALLESETQAKAIANAARYLTGAAQDGVASGYASDNRRSITTNNAATVNVDKLVVNDKQDMRALALEIGTVQRRAALGLGG